MHRKRMHRNSKVVEGFRTDVYEGFPGGGIVETNRVMGIRHLPVQDLFQHFGRAGRVEDDLVGRRIKWSEIWQALNVVPVEMRKQQMQLKTSPGALLLQMHPKFANACPRVDNDDAFLGLDLNAWGVAA